MSSDRFSSSRRGPGRSEAKEVEWPDWVKQAQANDALAREIEGLYVPVVLRQIAREEEKQFAQPMPNTLDKAAEIQFMQAELSWGETGADLIRRFVPGESSKVEYSTGELYERMSDELRYDDVTLNIADLRAALEKAHSIGILELGYKDNTLGAPQVYRLTSDRVAASVITSELAEVY